MAGIACGYAVCGTHGVDGCGSAAAFACGIAGCGIGARDGAVAAATAAEPQLLPTTGGALPVGELVGRCIGARLAAGGFAIGLAPRGPVGIGRLGIGELDIGGPVRTVLNSTGSDEIARGFANGMTLAGAGVTRPDKIDGRGAPERAAVVAGADERDERGGGTLRTSTIVTSPISFCRGT